jgi:hypothetical protein
MLPKMPDAKGGGVMAETILKGSTVLFDPEDAEIVASHTWYITRRKHTSYVVRSVYENGKKRCIYLHREIMLPPAGMEVDHINGDGLDNRRANLRIVTHTENVENNRRAPGESGYRGVRVTKTKGGNRWWASIKRQRREYHLGTFPTALEAHEAWKQAVVAWNKRVVEG